MTELYKTLEIKKLKYNIFDEDFYGGLDKNLISLLYKGKNLKLQLPCLKFIKKNNNEIYFLINGEVKFINIMENIYKFTSNFLNKFYGKLDYNFDKSVFKIDLTYINSLIIKNDEKIESIQPEFKIFSSKKCENYNFCSIDELGLNNKDYYTSVIQFNNFSYENNKFTINWKLIALKNTDKYDYLNKIIENKCLNYILQEYVIDYDEESSDEDVIDDY